jgi:hypothetical protein
MKVKNIYTPVFLYLLLWGSTAFAQPVQGRVNDGSGQWLPGVSVILLNAGDSSQVKGTTTNAEGSFLITNIPQGRYLLKATFIGYENYFRSVDLKGETFLAGTITLREKSKQLGEVVVKELMPVASQKGDTTEYNAGAFKVNKDANAEDLVSKMPGVTMQDGKAYAQGEEIKKVLVDGKEFFGDDASIALKNLPAEIIEKVQVFDKASDQSQFTGFKDGNTDKTMNIITKNGKSNGTFGKVYAGYGTSDRYLAGGNINFFQGARRISLIGLSNNVNQQNFSSQDLLGVSSGNSGGQRAGFGGMGRQGGGGPPGGGPRGGGGGNTSNFLVGQNNGINTNNSIGFNYIDTWGKKWKVNGSYFFNNTSNSTVSDINREYFLSDSTSQFYRESSRSSSSNYNHRMNLRMEYTIDSMNSLIITPALSMQKNRTEKLLSGATASNEGTLLNSTGNSTMNNNTGYNFSNSFLYRHRFGKEGRTISANLSTSVSDRDGSGNLESDTYTAAGDSSYMTSQQSRNATNTYSLSSNINYTEPIGKKAQLMLNYAPSYSENLSDRQTRNPDPGTQEYTNLDSALSNRYRNTSTTQRGGTALRYRGTRLSLSASLDYQSVSLDGRQSFPRSLLTQHTFNNWMPGATMEFRFTKKTNIRFNYNTSTSLPSITQLQDVIDNSNALQLSAGNPDLQQQYSHSLGGNFGTVSPSGTRTFFVFVSGSLSENYISNSSFTATQDTVLGNGIVLSQGGQLTRPVNLEGYRSLRSFLVFGFPFAKIRSNINVNGGVTYTRLPGLINNISNFSNSYTMNSGLMLSSNISENIDFRISYNSSYNIVNNSIQTSSNQDYYSGVASARINLVPAKHFVLNSDASYTHYVGLNSAYNPKILLWNAGVGYKFMKNEAAEIRLSVYDLLNQNQSLARNVTNTYIEDIQTQILKQYFMLTFTYNLRNFKS